jgi:hypothetical protein
MKQQKGRHDTGGNWWSIAGNTDSNILNNTGRIKLLIQLCAAVS